MIELKDQMHSTIRLEAPPRRIVSLVPSQTELLHDLGLEDEVVGITKFCIHPDAWFRSKTRVGGTKQIDIEKVRSLAPDLIIGNKEENTEEDIVALREIAPVYMSDIDDLEGALRMICDVGALCARTEASERMAEKIDADFLGLSAELAGKRRATVAYFIWHNPDYLAGKNTFIDAMLSAGGWKNATDLMRYPEVPSDFSPELVFLSSEPYPFREEHRTLFQEKFPMAKICLVDGEMFSWYGSRLLQTTTYLRKVSHELSEQ